MLSLLLEGSSLRAVARVTGVSINTVYKLLEHAGRACDAFHTTNVVDVPAKRVQCDEIWSFIYAKDKNVLYAIDAPPEAGTIWTWTAIDPDSKMVISYLIGDRGLGSATEFMLDLRSRLSGRVQLTTDGHHAYPEAVQRAFGSDVDFATTVKDFSGPMTNPTVSTVNEIWRGVPDEEHISTSLVERHNLTMRMSMRRYTRKTNGYSKDFSRHCHMLALYFVWYNWCRKHHTLKATPAMAAGLADRALTMKELAGYINRWNMPKGKRGPYKKRAEHAA